MAASPCILIVDDDDLFRETLRRMLHVVRPAFLLTEAGNGQEAYTAYKHHGADIILTDDQMPVMTGATLIQTLRAEHSTVPIVLRSGLRTTREVVAHDPYTVLTPKPVLFSDLLVVVDLFLTA